MADYSDLFDPEPKPNPALALQLTADAKPEEEADYLKLANRYKVPVPVVREFPDEYKARAKTDDVIDATANAPKLRSWLSDLDRARLSADDTPALAKLEEASTRTVLGTAGDVGTMALKGAVGLPQALVGLLNIPTLGYVGRALEDMGVDFKRAQGILSGEEGDTLLSYSPAQQAANQRFKEAQGFINTLGTMLSNPSTVVTTVGESWAQMLGGAAIGKGILAVAPKLAPWLAAAFGEGILGAGSSAEQIRAETDDGLLTVKQSFASVMSGAGTALFGAAGGKVANKLGLADIDTTLVARGMPSAEAALVKQGFVSSVVKSGISEGVFEELPQSMQEQMWQNWATDRPLSEGVGKAAAQGLLAGMAMGGGFQALQPVIDRLAESGDQGKVAQDAADHLNEMMRAANSSALRERSPEQFRELASQMTDGATIHVDAQVLNQLPEEVLAQLPESVRAQIPDAALANASVEIPMADVLTIAPGTPMEQVLNDHARMTPEAMSRADAVAAGDQADVLRQDAERVIQQAQDQQAARAEYDSVKQRYSEQIAATGRYRPAVAEQMGDWLASFYTAYGARTGMSASELQAKYPVRIEGAPTSVGQVMDQVQVTDQVDESTGLPLNSDGTVTLYHHTSKQNADGIAKSGTLKSAGEPAVYLTTRKETDTGYGDTAVAVRVRPNQLRIDDEFPDGRRDYSVDVGKPGGSLQVQVGEAGGVLNQSSRPVSPRVAGVADIGAARVIAESQEWPTSRDFKMALQAAVRAVTGSMDLSKDSPEVRAYLTQQILKEAREALVTNANAVGWYDDKVTTALEVVSAIHPELKTNQKARFAFIWALAVTSNGVKVNKNFELAEKAYSLWKASSPDVDMRRMPTTNIGVGTAAGKINEALATYNNLISRWGYDKFQKFATTFQPNRRVLAEYGRKVSGEGLDTMVFGAGIVGPKIGNGFFMNLYGEFGQLTMDRWWVRMWGRLTGDLVVVDRTAIAESRAAFVSIVEMIKADKAATKVVEQAIKTRLGKGNPITMAKAIMKATTKKEVRDTLATVLPATPEREAAVAGVRKIKDFVSIGDELRKAAKGYYMNLDGQIEVPGGSKRRDMMRGVSRDVLAELQKEHPHLTMADFQALMWYPEKTLYDSAGAQLEESEEGYEDDEAPDYANAAIKLARDQGIPDAAINAAVERARSDIQARQRAGRSGRGTGDVPADVGNGPGVFPNAKQDTLSQTAVGRGADFGDGLSWETTTENLITADIGGGFSMAIFADAEDPAAGAQLSILSDDGVDQMAPLQFKTVSEAMQAAPYVLSASGVPGSAQLNQQAQTPRGTFSPATLELVLNPNANLSTFFHETGHFFLEVLADLASQPNAPPQIVEDFNTFLKWAGTDRTQWAAWQDEYAASGKLKIPAGLVKIHERWAESIEQYIMEGKAPSVELQPLMRRFATWLKSVYGSIKQFLAMRGQASPGGEALGQSPAPEGVVTDDNGDPLVVYHGTDKEFTVFDNTQSKSQRNRVGGETASAKGYWFAESRRSAERYANGGARPKGVLDPGKRVVSAYLLMKKPLVIDMATQQLSAQEKEWTFPSHDTGSMATEIGFRKESDVRSAIALGHDGIVYINGHDGNFYGGKIFVVFDPKQIVSAISGDVLGQSAFHGTPHRGITKFSTDKIGTGEGNQAYGWGLYFASKRDIAEYYRKALSGDGSRVYSRGSDRLEATADLMEAYYKPGRVVRGYSGADKVLQFKRTPDYGWTVQVIGVKANGEPMANERPRWHATQPDAANLKDVLAEDGWEPSVPGQLYEVDIPEDGEMLLWDKHLDEQPGKVLAALNTSRFQELAFRKDGTPRNVKADVLYNDIAEMLGMESDVESQRAASEALLALGIKGIKYLDGGSRRAGDGSYNYVVFSGDDVAIKGQFYQEPAAQPGPPMALNDDIRRVMDRMLATDEQIQQANEVAGLVPDMDADAEAAERLNKRSMRDLALSVKARDRAITDLRKEAKALEKQIRAEVTAEVNEMPVYLAKDAVERAVAETDADPVAADARLDSIATQYGYTSIDHMAREIENAQPKGEVIDGRVDERMLEEHGDLTDERAIQQAANEAVHNEARARSLATELRSQDALLNARDDTGETNRRGARITVNALVEAAKQFGAGIVARTTIRDLKSKAWQHTAAERRAGNAWRKATAKAKTAEAVQAKRDQVLNNAAAKSLLDADANVAKLLQYAKKFDKASVREKLPPEYLDQIDKLLERVDLRVSTTGRQIDRRASLAKWVEAQHAIGLDPVLPDNLLEDIQLKSYKEMTYDEFVELTESIKNIEHLGRLKSKLLAAKDKREFDAIVQEWSDSIRANGGKAKPVRLEPDNRIVSFFKGAWAEHRKLNSLIRQMDGGEAGGPGFRVLIQSMNERGTQEDVALEKATMALAEIFAPIDKLPGGLSGDKRFIPAIDNSLSRAGRLSIALNWGNAQNRQRVMDGDGWTEDQVNAILATLTTTELQFVNQVWAHIDSYWPDVKAKQLRVSGVVEDKVEAEPFVLASADGTLVPMRGGYYPIKYDPDRSIRAQINEAKEIAADMLRGAMLRPTTRRGHTKARVEEVKGRPLRKDLAPITQHVSQVVHDLAWHEWAIDANRLLSDPRISAAIRDHHGAEIHRAMTEAVEAIVVGNLAKQTDIDRLLLQMRANVTRSIMGVSATTALLQPFGLTQSMARIGVVPVLKGAARWAGDAAKMESTIEWIYGKSEFMRLRGKTFNRELREINQTIQGKWKVTKVMDAVLFFPMAKMQMIADAPTWVGMYEKSLAEGRDEDTAIALADEAVLSAQGGGGTKDSAGVQRNLPFLTQFYSYFSTTLNLVAEKTALTDFKNPRAVAGWVGDMALLAMIPAILPALITFALKGGGEDDEPEDWAKRLAEWQASYLLGMFVGLRELPTLWSPFDYGGPPAGKLINDGKRLVQQAGQGEIDDPAVLAAIGFLGTALGIPTTQIIRSYKGWKAWDEGDAPPTSILFGPPPKD